MKAKNAPLYKRTLITMVALFLNACANLAPDYQQPETPLADSWIDLALQAQNANAIAPTNLSWRDYFIDPRLQTLITTALEHNHDLRTAALNIELAQAQYGIRQANELPTINLSTSATRAKSSATISDSYSANLGISSFELDFFSRLKNLTDAALNDYLATREAHDAAQLSLINSVAKAYFQWLNAQALQALAQQTLISRQESYQQSKNRFQAGLISAGSNLSTAQSAIAAAQASYQEQQRNIQQAENALTVLIGQPLSQLNLPQGNALDRQISTQQLLLGLPSEVLLNRPDIREAEYSLKSANANIGAARAALFPSITLTASTGYSSSALNSLISNSAQAWSLAPSLNLPIFDAGERATNVEVSEINQKIAIESYQKAVQSAFQEVSDALIARETLIKQLQAEQDGENASAETLRMVKLQMQDGLATGLELLDAERSHFAAQQSALTTLLLLSNAQADLYTTLGGGLYDNNQSPPIQTPDQKFGGGLYNDNQSPPIQTPDQKFGGGLYDRDL